MFMIKYLLLSFFINLIFMANEWNRPTDIFDCQLCKINYHHQIINNTHIHENTPFEIEKQSESEKSSKKVNLKSNPKLFQANPNYKISKPFKKNLKRNSRKISPKLCKDSEKLTKIKQKIKQIILDKQSKLIHVNTNF